MPRHLSGRCVSLGVDYLTVTAREQTRVDLLRAQSFALAEVEMSLGFRGRPWSMSGYEGFKCGGLEYGERYDGCIVRLHDTPAQSHWRRFYEHCDNCTRIDLQATFNLDQPVTAMLRSHLREMRLRDRKRKGKPQTALHVSRDGGITIDSGYRGSDRFLRIYDKGVQSGVVQYLNCIRYEAELKNRQAQMTAFWLFGLSSEHSSVALYVLALSSERGATPGTLSKDFYSTASRDAPKMPARLSDDVKAREWLRKSVRPTVRYLASVDGSDSVRRLLGID